MSFPLGQINNNTDGAAGKSFDIKKFLFRLWDFAPWIILSLLLSYGVALLVLRYAKPIHLVTSYVLIKDNEENSSNYNILREMGVMQNSKEVQNQIDIIQSYTMMLSVIDSLNLDIALIAKGKIAQTDLYGKNSPVSMQIKRSTDSVFTAKSYQIKFAPDKCSIEKEGRFYNYAYGVPFVLNTIEITINPIPGQKFSEEDLYFIYFHDREQLSKSLHNTIHVAQLHDMGGIIQVNYADAVPERGVDIVNTLISTYNAAGLNDKNIVTVKTVDFLKERIDTISRELDQLEMQAELYKQNNKLTNVGELGNLYLNQSVMYDKEIAMESGNLQILKGIEDYLNTPQASKEIVPSVNGLTEPTMLALIDQYNRLVLEYQEQAGVSTSSDPVLLRRKKQLDDLRMNIVRNISNIKKGYGTRIGQLQSTKNDFDHLLSGLPEAERIYTKLKRQIGVKEQIYLYLLQRKEETDMSLASNINDTRVVDPAIDMGVIEPNKSKIISLALSLGLAIPIIILLIIDFFNNKISERREIEEGTTTPIVGELSFLERLEERLITFNNKSLVAEQFRMIRTNLRYINVEPSGNIILVTSFMSGEGKSFTSMNLAASFAAAGSKVLLLELDLRKPKLAEYMHEKKSHGFSDFIVNAMPKEQIIHHNKAQKFDYITSGTIPPNPSEMLMHPKVSGLFEALKKEYDYIIVDTAPAGMVADTFMLNDYADSSIFILRYQYSFKSSIEYIERINKENKLKRLCIIVNGIKRNKKLYYGYGYGYNDIISKPYGEGYIDFENGQKEKKFSIFPSRLRKK